jgi:ubiquinone/menaquinone biosynthesis C-methylase UbiE
MTTLGTYARIAAALIGGRTVGPRELAAAYDRVSDGYDKRFLQAMGEHNEAMLAEMAQRLPERPRVLDIACGTGFNSRFLREAVGGTYELSDISAGMLAIAQANVPGAVCRQLDMLEHLRSLPDESFDAVVCAWAIKYSTPPAVAKEMARVLAPRGFAAVIVNRRDTLPEIRAAFPGLMARHGESLGPVLLDLPNPTGAKQFTGWFTRAGLTPVTVEEGERVFTFETGGQAADWVTSTGALAGFDCMLDLRDERVLADLGDALQAGGRTLTHRFVWGVFERAT